MRPAATPFTSTMLSRLVLLVPETPEHPASSAFVRPTGNDDGSIGARQAPGKWQTATVANNPEGSETITIVRVEGLGPGTGRYSLEIEPPASGQAGYPAIVSFKLHQLCWRRSRYSVRSGRRDCGISPEPDGLVPEILDAVFCA